MDKGGEIMTLDEFIKAVDPYSLLAVEIATSEPVKNIYVKGTKYDVLSQLKGKFNNLEIYQVSLNNYLDVRNNDTVEYFFYILAKEK